MHAQSVALAVRCLGQTSNREGIHKSLVVATEGGCSRRAAKRAVQ